MITVFLQKAKATLTELLKEIEKGNEVIIIDGNKPIAKLIPVTRTSAKSERKLGSAKGKVMIADDFDGSIEDFDPVPATDSDDLLN